MNKLFTRMFLSLLLLAGFASSAVRAQVSHLVISQVYGGGGNSGATFKNDFIEVFNPTASTVNVSGWSVQYASAAGSSWAVTVLSGTIPAGGYYLVQEAAGTGGTTNLPIPDATGTLNLSGTSGKVALSNSSVALTGTCPAGGAVIDFIGFGGANCFEGSACPTLSNTTAALRGSNGCKDTDVNSSDFTTGLPNPRNSSSPVNICGAIAKTVSVAAGAGAAEPAANGSFTISFSTPTTASTDIDFAYSGTAGFGTDYTVTYSTGTTISTTASGTLTVPVNTSVVTVSIIPIDDALVEGNEAIALTFSSPTQGYALGAASANINIADDDIPTLSVSPAIDAAEPATSGTFTITLSNSAPAGGVVINYNLSGTATLNTDYSDPQSGTITIPSGSTTGTISLNTIDDLVYEGTETIAVNLTSASNGFAIATSTATINLTDDEPTPAIVINEVYGGGGNSGADFKNDFIELYNTTNNSVNLNGWSVQYGSATGTTWSGKTLLTGTIPPLGYYLVQESAGTGGTTDLPTPDAIGTISMSGTAGKVALLSNATTISGACPAGSAIVDLVGFGLTANCFEGAGPTPAPSNTTSVQRSPKGFDTNNNNTDFGVLTIPTPKNSVIDLTPPSVLSLSPADDATSILTSFTASITFSENIQKGTGTILLKKVSDGSVVKTIDVTSAEVSITGAVASFDLNSLAFNTGYYFEISAGAFKDGDDNNFAGITGSTTWNFTTSATPPAGILGNTYNFNACSGNLPDGFTQYNIVGPQIWACTAFGRDAANLPSGSAPNGLQINGFSGTNIPNEDWLISPSFNLTGTSFPLLSFWSRTAFTGATLQLKVSTNYSGTGDPNLATWTDLNGKFPGEVSDVWSLSDNINLSAYKSANTYFAFVYTSTSDDGARWTLDDITLTNSATPPPPSITIGATDIQYTFVANGSTLDKTFTFTGNDLTADLTINSTGAFLLSKDGTSFNPTLTYTVAEASDILKTVYVRFAPTTANQNFTGLISITTPGAATDTINLKGTSIDPATTLEVVNWNMEWFGSPVLGPTDDNLQQQNATTILTNIAADIFGVVEIVDEARLQAVVNSLNTTYGAGTYSYIICNYGSHVNPPEPGGGPLSAAQKEAFIYKTALFSNVTTRALINNQDVNSTSYNSWSSGRYPFLMTADVTLNCVTKKINFVLVHAKANTAPTATAYARRQASATELHDTLNTYFANDNIIMLGDFNDDLDQSITAGFTTTSYSAFTTDTAHFFSPTLALSVAGKKSTVSYNDVIDHVMLSKEIAPFYMPSSATILTDVAALVNKYGTTTTDHYPVFTRYIFPNAIAPVVISCTPLVTYCANSASTYTVPAFTATDDCQDVVSYNYAISGSTVRSGTTNDASGSFNTGTSIITWTATDTWGNAATCSTMVVINANPTATISASGPTSFCPGGAVVLTSSPAVSYVWSNTLTSQSVIISQSGSYFVMVTDNNGCSGTSDPVIVTASDNIPPTIIAPPAVSVFPSGGCSASGVDLGTPVTNDNCHVASVTNNAPSIFPAGTTTVTWTVKDDANNIATATQTVMVNRGPQVAPITGNTTICVETTTQLADATQGGIWSSSNSSIARVSNKGLVRGNSPGTAVISYAVTNSCGTTTVQTPVIVNPRVVIAAQPQSAFKCTGEPVTFSVVATGTNLSYQWRKAGIPIAGATGPSYTINSISVHDVNIYSVVVSGSCGRPVVSNPAILLVKIYAIIASAGPHGSITSKGIAITPCGTDRRYDFTPAAGYHVSEVKIDGILNVAAVNDGYYTFTDIKGNHLISVRFIANTITKISGSKSGLPSIADILPVKPTASGLFEVQVFPNPSSDHFMLKVQSSSDEKIGIRLIDGSGKVLRFIPGVTRNSTVRVGDNFINGTYFAEVMQGTNIKIVRLVKVK